MTVLCLVIGGAIIIGERCMDARDRWHRRAQELTCLAHLMACLNPDRYDAMHGDGAHAADLAAIQAAAHQETP